KFKLDGHAIHGILYDAQHEVMIAEASAFMAECKLLYRYKGTDPGFPFAFDMNIRYRLEGANRLTVITTVHNRSGQTIPICDGWHPYFKLGDSIDSASLQFNSKKELEFNKDLMPTGKVINNKKWFRGASLKDVKLDNIFLIDQQQPMPHCILSDETMKLAIYFYPDEAYPYLLIYTPDDRKSIAIENHSAPPDAFNNKIGLIELGPEDSKAFTIKYRIAPIDPTAKSGKRNWFDKLFSKA
ncbi:MAG: aldose 1-epimerase, partial [bacterium]